MRISASIAGAFSMILIGFLVLSISGCGTQDKGPIVLDDPKFHTGYGGLEVNFLKGMPPDQVWEGTQFPLGVEIRNTGAWSITDAKVALSGFSKDLFHVSFDSKGVNDDRLDANEDSDVLIRFNDIKGRDYNLPEGDNIMTTWTITNTKIPYGDEYDSPFMITACYGYKTEAGADVCIDPHVNYPVEIQQKGCTMKEVRLAGGQGSPVAVSSIKPDIIMQVVNENGKSVTKKRLQLIIKVENKGGGQIRYHGEYGRDCAGTKAKTPNGEQDQLEYATTIPAYYFNYIMAYVELSGEQMDCNLRNIWVDSMPKDTNSNFQNPEFAFPLKYSESEDSILLCSKDISDKSEAYLAPVTVYLKYGYITHASKSIKVKRLFARDYGYGDENTQSQDTQDARQDGAAN